MAIKLANNAKSSLSNAIGSGDLQIKVQLGDENKFPTLAVGDWLYLTIISEPTYGTDSEIFEIVKVTAITLNTLDIERGAEGTMPQAFALGDICEQRITRQTLIDLATGTPVIKERIYRDEIRLQIKLGAIPASGGDLRTMNMKYAPKLMTEWNSSVGAKSKLFVKNLTDNLEYDDLQFNTLDDIVNWKNANSVGNTQTIIAKIYDEIDETIPVVTRMYSQNRFLAAGKGKGNYTSFKAATGHYSKDMESHFSAILNNVIGTFFDGSEMNMTEIVWFGRNTKNKYIKPPVKTSGEAYRVDLSQGSADKRSVWDWGGSDISGAKNTLFTLKSSDNYTYVALDLNNNLDIIGDFWYEAQKAVLDGKSVMVAWKMTSNDDPNHVAMQMKPIGIDCIVIDQPDWTKYDLEFVYFNNDKQNYVDTKSFSNSSDFNHSFFDENGGQIRISSMEWISGGTYNSNMMRTGAGNKNNLGFDTVYLRLRNKTTGAVGRLSPGYIKFEKSNDKMCGYRFMIKSDKKG